jgi:hypothetical protein
MAFAFIFVPYHIYLSTNRLLCTGPLVFGLPSDCCLTYRQSYQPNK